MSLKIYYLNSKFFRLALSLYFFRGFNDICLQLTFSCFLPFQFRFFTSDFFDFLQQADFLSMLPSSKQLKICFTLQRKIKTIEFTSCDPERVNAK